MLALDRTPLHWKTYLSLVRLCDLAGIDWTRRGPQSRRTDRFNTDPEKARELSNRYHLTAHQAAAALRRNFRWHDTHPGKRIRNGDIPF